MTKKKNKVEALPPGDYVGTMTKIRKIRNKNAYRMELEVNGVKLVSILPFQPEKDKFDED